MLFEDFLIELEKTKSEFDWQVVEIYDERCIRASYKKTKTGSCKYCPITAVCRNLDKGYFMNFDFPKAAKELGMSYSLANIIAASADGPSIENFSFKTRVRILEILGL